MSKRKSKGDPYAEREASKYAKPIPSREFIMQHLAERGVPLSFKRIASGLNIHDEDELEGLRRRLNAMERDGQLISNRRRHYGLVSRMDLVRGRVTGHPDGFGFLIPDDGAKDLYLTNRQMRSLMHGDRAVVRVAGVDKRGRREGALVEVLERANHRVVGRYFVEDSIGFVVPSNTRINQDIVVQKGESMDAQNSQIVVVEILRHPDRRNQPVGKIIEILGDHMAPGMEIDIAIRAFELPQEWPQEVEQEISAYTGEVPEAAKQGREDLRDLPLVTIDGEDARDFDDAVYCEPEGKGWRLLVAIADVSHYVKSGSALDTEAIERGNSVYFPERVIPMLPEVLSNGLCSLNPEVDRLCMVCEMSIDGFGKVKRYRFFEGLMRSHARLTYNKVAAMLVDKDSKLLKQYKGLVPHLENLYELYKALREARDQRGAIDFETTETRIVFGEDRKIECIVPVVRNDAHKIIEECMVTANVAAADFLLEKHMPALYRVHETPGTDKLTNVREFLSELGLSLGGGDSPEPSHYAKLLGAIQERPDLHLIQTVLLRSMCQAVYSPDNIGHFGLAYDGYAHFTSPIRRYPDLLVHRAIRHALANKTPETFAYGHGDMENFGDHCSMTERRADEATMDTVSWLKCEYMMDKVGEEYSGTISGVTGFGIFIELDEIYVEGLVHVTALRSDYYHFDPVKHRLEGERTRKTYRLGDRVQVKVVRVDLDERKIDFELAS